MKKILLSLFLTTSVFADSNTVIKDNLSLWVSQKSVDMIIYYEVGGRSYYGSVFFKDGIRYAGYYETAGQLVQVYATLQESITGEITTRPSAIQRSGTTVNSNNQQLNIPGTPSDTI